MGKQIWKVKPVNTSTGDGGLKRVLDKWALTMLGIGAIIGAGIFVMTGKAAGDHAGPALPLSFIFAGLGCALAGLCYAEFAAMLPISGSAYAYAYATLGELVAWVIGWALVLEYLFAASTVAVSWSGYLSSFLGEFGVFIPKIISSAPIIYDEKIGEFVATGSLINLPAVLIIAVLTSLLVIGISESTKINNIVVFIKVLVIALFIIFGFIYILKFGLGNNWTPYIPEEIVTQKSDGSTQSQYGWFGILSGASIVFFSYIGFDAVSTAAQEAKNPNKDMPFGILVSLGISTLLYIAVAMVLTGVVNYKDMSTEALAKLPVHIEPISLAVDKMVDGLGLGSWLGIVINLGAIGGLTTVILVMLMGQPRIFFSMANDGLIPSVFARVHPKYKTPHINTMITGAIAIILAGTLPIGILGDLVVLGTLLAFVIVCIGIWILRVKQPNIHRPFKTPFVPFIPIVGALVCLGLMAGKGQEAWLIFLGWMGLGLLIYFGYGIKHSKLVNAKTNPSNDSANA